jgi:presenilin-like A22 family membrane protease
MNSRAYIAGGATIAVFLLVQIGALALIEPFQTVGYRAVENPTNPANTLIYLLGVFVATGVMLVAFRFGAEQLVRVFVIASSAFLVYYVFSVFLPVGIVNGVNFFALWTAVALAAMLFVYPEWYVIDSIGIVMGMGAAGLFGISLGILPALLLLTILAVYDAISVYGTEHMLTLASGVMDLKIPVVLVIPLTLSYSYLDSTPPESVNSEDNESETVPNGGTSPEDDTDSDDNTSNPDQTDDAEEESEPRDAFFIGLGDAVMPSVLVASAAYFLPTGQLIEGFALTLPALTAMLGTLAGLVVLIRMVMQGRAHAGLPLLNGGAIGGYLVGALVSGVPLIRALGLTPYF